jgi:hypothetical protein
MRHVISGPDEVYLEKIGCVRPGCGIGSLLLAWGHEFAKASGATRMTLDVMTGNKAKQLYVRQGCADVAKCNYNLCDVCIGAVMLYLCLGCYYCRISEMEKQL